MFLDVLGCFKIMVAIDLSPKLKKQLKPQRTKMGQGLLRFAQVYLLLLLFTCLCLGLLLFTQPADKSKPKPKKQPKAQTTKTAQKSVNNLFHTRKFTLDLKKIRVRGIIIFSF
jgi:hypothetical protein